eukprot:TRINITY_DN17789_c0_g1_i1.p1 TRINITY_DN17789_c0_g1~~TRINITY_DN17789_c0_g1_i1.p1  ORF type:complete len:363 (-),score=77.90 TRINITY_DN17789_c0_g1_i1:40-1128(-)
MGQAHVGRSPVKDKDSGDGSAESKQLEWGYSCMQGWRPRMEDAHFALPSLNNEDWARTAAFGVLDGHGGREVAYFCEQQLPSAIASASSSDPKGALIAAFQKMDELLFDVTQQDYLRSFTGDTRDGMQLIGADRVGCATIVCLVQAEHIIVANAGDCRAVLARESMAVPLSEDHKPNLPSERERIQKAGGSVERQQVGPIVQYRVNGNLNLSRSIGDLDYKKNPHLLPSEQLISCTPDVVSYSRKDGDDFIVIACDGVWERMGNQDIVDFVAARLPKHLEDQRPLSWIMEELLDQCFSPNLQATDGLGGDNMTAMLVLLRDRDQYSNCLAKPITSFDVQASQIDDLVYIPSGFCSCSTGSRK